MTMNNMKTLTAQRVSDYQCRCCGHDCYADTLWAREMMYGTRERFQYDRCASCGSLQLRDVPEDLARFYLSDGYPCWAKVPAHILRDPPWLRRAMIAQRTDFELGRASPLGWLLRQAFGPAEFPYDWNWLRRPRLSRTDRLLDFGCGSGELLRYLRANAFVNLCGVDPFAEPGDSRLGLQFHTALQEGWSGRFDCAMLHHSLEHVPDPLQTLRSVLECVRPDGTLLVRVPLSQSWAEREYGTDWVQLDAPRHLVLPSEKGMRRLGERLGLRLEHIDYDSTRFQFMGSEQYRLDIPMYDESRSRQPYKNSQLDDAQFTRWDTRAAELNASGDGDQASFYFRRIGASRGDHSAIAKTAD